MTIAEKTFSVVVSTIDRAEQLRTLLRTLEHQSYPHFEVIVVVGPTCDNTIAVLSQYKDRVRVLRCPSANLSRSRNIGLLAARGDLVAFIDDDAVPCQRWLEQLNRLFADQCLDGTGGITYSILPNHSTIQFRLGIASSLADRVDSRSSGLEHVVLPAKGSQWVARVMGTNMAFRRQVLLERGGFDEFYSYIAEETDLAMRLAHAGCHLHPVKEAAVYHVPGSSRNRTMFRHSGKFWRLETRSEVYYCIKNGPLSGDSYTSILLQCLRLVGIRLRMALRFWLRKELDFDGMLGIMAGQVPGALAGAMGGIFRTRKLLEPSVVQPVLKSTQPIQPFQNGESAKQPSIDPVSGRQPSITLPEPPLRICLLSHTYPPAQYDGVGRLTNLMARGLFECGHTVHVITQGERERVAFYDGAYVHQIPDRLDRYETYQRFINLHHTLNLSHAIYDQVKRLMLNDGIQIVDSPLWLFGGLVTSVSGSIPVVVRLVTALRQVTEVHHTQASDTALMCDLERLLMERAAHLLPNTQATLDTIQKLYGVQPTPDRYTVIPYGIVPAPEEAIRPFDPKQGGMALTVLFVGRLEKRKGILDLFQAIPLILKQVPNVRFVIAGSDNSYYDGFQAKTGMNYPAYFAKHYQRFTPHVIFLGAVSDESLQNLYQSCDLFVAPSLYESFGLVYLEAMNYAKPVIGCHAGGIPEVIEDGVTGLLVEPEAPAALAEAMISLLKSPARLRELGVAGRQQLLEKFTYLQMARNFERAYRNVIRAFNDG
jgi:glycogen synthase